MVYKIMNTEDLTPELTAKYFYMLSEQRRKKIKDMETAEERSRAFCSEILARRCLSELLDAPEFSFNLLCNPDSLSVVGNYNASICIVHRGSFVACAASEKKVGICIVPVMPFPFREAQKIFTDSEIRSIYSDSVYTFGEIINMTECREKSVMQKFALFSALKEAHFKSTGRGIRTDSKKTEFIFDGTGLKCSDPDCNISVAIIDKKTQLAISVIERK